MTEEGRLCAVMVVRVDARRPVAIQEEGRREPAGQLVGEATDPTLAGNNLKTVEVVVSVPQTDTGRQGEKPKARE